MGITAYELRTAFDEFSLRSSASIVFNSNETNPAALALADGGFAVVTRFASIDTPGNYSLVLEIGNADGSPRFAGPSSPNIFTAATLVREPALTQLTNGNILVTWTDADGPSIHYALVSSVTGAVVKTDAALPGTDANDFDSQVVALANGGWAIVKQDNVAGNQDADLLFYDSTGANTGSAALGGDSTSDERNPVVAVLDNGNVAVAFEKELSDGSGTYGQTVQIFTSTGGVVLAPFAFDTSGSFNLNSSIVALKDGGFAVAYDESNRVAVAFFDEAGALRGTQRILSVADPSLAVLPNGYLAVTYSLASGSETDVRLHVYDPVSMGELMTFEPVETQSGNQGETSGAVLTDGTLLLAWTDLNNAIEDGNTDPNGSHVAAQGFDFVKIVSLDYFGENYTGDALREEVNGGFGGDDTILGLGGDDTLSGNGGVDYVDGGDGDDELLVKNGGVDASDVYIGGAGTDTLVIQPIGNFDLTNSNFADLERLRYASDGSGGAIARFLASQFIFDTVFYDPPAAGDRVVKLAMGNITTLDLSSVAIEGTPAAGDRFEITGDGDAEAITGTSIADILDGMGGADTMTGGGGNDTYHVDTRNDRTIEAPGGGTDTVISSIGRTLGTDLENLTLTGTAVTGKGNTLDNVITGNGAGNSLQGYEGNDTLIGGDGDDELRGAEGSDSMTGGLGNDRYFVNAAGDVVDEATADGGGIDTVYSQMNYTLGANIENLRLQGTAGFSGTGNELNNRIFGNTGANVLKGLVGNDTIEGNDGADTIEGGEGNDTLSGGGNADVFRFATSNTGVDRILDFSKNFDRFDLSGGTFTAISTAANGDTVLTHAGGFIRIATPPNLTLAQWNALVLPSGGRVAPDDAAAGISGLFHAAPGATVHGAGEGHPAALLRHDLIIFSDHGDWAFA